MAKQKIRIKLKAYDHRVLDASVRQIVDAAEQTGAQVVGPVPLPTSIEKYTVMRSPFIDLSFRKLSSPDERMGAPTGAPAGVSCK